MVGIYFERANKESRKLMAEPEPAMKIDEELNDLENYVNKFFASQNNFSRTAANQMAKTEVIKTDEKTPTELNEEEEKTVLDLASKIDLEDLYGKAFGKKVSAFGRVARFSLPDGLDDPLTDEAKSVGLVTDESMRDTLDDPFSTTY
jgi:hypothetical protein